MVRVCAFPNCGNKNKRYLGLSFHCLPLRNPETLPLWLVALRLDVNTSLKELKAKDYRVCGAHFDEDDFSEKSSKHRHLKVNAIPKATSAAAENSKGTTSSEMDKDLPNVPQSTPKKASHPSSIRLMLFSPPTTSDKQHTRPSTSGIYLAQPPFMTQADDTEHSMLDLSTSLGEMAILDQTDTSYEPSTSGTPSSSQRSLSGSASANGNGKEEKRWLVNESKLLELFRLCTVCGAPVEDRKIFTRASQIRVVWNCTGNHSGQWSSCPEIRGMAENNLTTSAAIFFSGTTHTTINDWAEVLHTNIPQYSHYYNIQSTYLIPVIQDAYRLKHNEVMERLIQLSQSGEKIHLCGDARCDSPGFSAKYCTYSFQDDATKEIVHFEFVQVTEASSSVAMEVLGFQRGLDYLLEKGLVIEVITTDRSPSIRKLMKDNYGSIRHELDPWHVCKSVKKKLLALSQKKENRDLQPWIRSIINHIYWSCETSNGDKEECVRRWTSLLHHICGVHRWEENDITHTCDHPTLTEEQQRRKKWLKPDSAAWRTLKGVVMDKNLLRDFRQMALFKHTGSLEVFHSVMLKYAEKRLHFWYDSMRARTQLAILDHNSNVGRPQAKTTDGKPKYKKVYSRQAQRWVLKPIYECTSQAFRYDLMERVLKKREDSTIISSKPRRKRRGRRLLCNIAPVPRPNDSVLVAEARSRYMNTSLCI